MMTNPRDRMFCVVEYETLGVQSPCQMMIGMCNHLLSKVFRFHYHSVIGSLGKGTTSTWRIIPVSKWLITMVIVSPLNGVIPLINALFMAYKWGLSSHAYIQFHFQLYLYFLG